MKVKIKLDENNQLQAYTENGDRLDFVSNIEITQNFFDQFHPEITVTFVSDPKDNNMIEGLDKNVWPNKRMNHDREENI